MKVKFNYYLKIKEIMNKDYDVFTIEKPISIREIFEKNLPKDKLNMIDLSELMIVSDGKNIENLDTLVDMDIVFSICPKIYGG